MTDYKCDKCGKPMVIKTGRYGEFLSCTGYPTCKNAQARAARHPVSQVRRRHHRDQVAKRRGGRSFYGCSKYSSDIKCEFKLWQKPVHEPCPSCGAKFLVFGGGKKNPMLVCQTEDCGFKKPIEESSLAQPLPRACRWCRRPKARRLPRS